ncbi:MAG TPA: hypothetical protein VGG91_18370, partial [Myxococcaceae bacterium]
MGNEVRRYVAGQCAFIALSAALLVVLRHNARLEIGFFLDSFAWLWVFNLFSFGMITLFSVRAHWMDRLASTLMLDLGSSV